MNILISPGEAPRHCAHPGIQSMAHRLPDLCSSGRVETSVRFSGGYVTDITATMDVSVGIRRTARQDGSTISCHRRKTSPRRLWRTVVKAARPVSLFIPVAAAALRLHHLFGQGDCPSVSITAYLPNWLKRALRLEYQPNTMPFSLDGALQSGCL